MSLHTPPVEVELDDDGQRCRCTVVLRFDSPGAALAALPDYAEHIERAVTEEAEAADHGDACRLTAEHAYLSAKGR